jgi:hypothetical protein
MSTSLNQLKAIQVFTSPYPKLHHHMLVTLTGDYSAGSYEYCKCSMNLRLLIHGLTLYYIAVCGKQLFLRFFYTHSELLKENILFCSYYFRNFEGNAHRTSKETKKVFFKSVLGYIAFFS